MFEIIHKIIKLTDNWCGFGIFYVVLDPLTPTPQNG